MAENSIKVSLIGTDRSLGRTLTGASKKAFILGNDLQRVGRSLTRHVTLPIVALGAASVIAAMKVDNSYDVIRAGTGATGKKLDGLKKTFEDVAGKSTQGLDETAQAIADLNTRLGLTGKPLNVMARRFLELSRMTKTDVADNIRLGTRLFGDWSIATGDQAAALDKLFRTTQQTGVGIGSLMETVVKFGAPLRNLGFDFESSIAMLGKWEKEGVNVDTALTGMRFALKTFASEGKDPLVAMGKAIEQIKELPKLKALAVGKDTFGLRAFSDVVAAIREGRFEYDDLVKSVKNGKDTIMGASADTLSLSDKLSILKNRLTIVGAGVGEALLPVIEDLAGYVQRAAEWFDNLSDAQKDWLIKAAGAAAVLGPFLSLLGGTIKGVVRLAAAYKAVAKWAGLAAAAEKGLGGGGIGKLGKLGKGVPAASGLVTGAGAGAAGAGAAAGSAGMSLGATFAAVAAPIIAGAVAAAIVNKKYHEGQSQSDERAAYVGSQRGSMRPGTPVKDPNAPAISGAKTVQKMILDLQVKGATDANADMGKLAAKMDLLKKVAADPILLGKLDGDHTVTELQEIERDMMRRLGIGKKQADKIMGAMFKEWNPSAVLNPKINKAAAGAEKRIAALRAKAAKQIEFGNADVTGLINSIASVTGAFNSMSSAARTAGDAAVNALLRSQGATGGGKFKANGGVIYGRQDVTVGEAGPEAIIPLTRPNRAAQVMAEAGLLNDGGGSATPAGRRVVIEEHYHYHMPGGSVLVGTMAEAGKLMAPHAARANALAESRHGRGR